MPDRNATRNTLIAAMDEETAWAVLDASERVELDVHYQLQAPNTPNDYVYFPESGVTSIVAHAPGGLKIETGIIGKEGMVGITVLSGVNQSPHEIFVQMATTARRIPVDQMRSLIADNQALQDLLVRYLHTVHLQVACTALANGRTTIVQRLARWLLMCHDRVGSPRLSLTHEFLSLMLGTRRAGVTTALHILEGEHLIRSERSICTITDRAGLKARAGGIYGIPEAEYRRLIGVSAQDQDAIINATAASDSYRHGNTRSEAALKH
ncbi:cyclic nucleotide-binding domain-containing protein [Rhizobium gallicum bv. gallicum R602sp]|uniref:Cyclic nucleotide-binding domain-containing protein n=1 Tax=Rhizobium gallicum bv. gallicum R602sp TaxID=1041138 RepID=A0A0B4X7D4_9HYPH|nr:Crp/Fnr family transcriptional regulator [Rhizobium gallicum]AJD42645.1 cyclic nucleotide-binding domain-containing protein [Rhizobium gallicum bv. gallicum R602sp]